MPRRIRIGKRIIPHIAVPIQVLGIEHVIHDGVGADEAADDGVIQACVHVDEAGFGVCLVAGVAAAGHAEARRASAPVAGTWVAEFVKADVAGFGAAGIGDDVD